MSDHRFKTGVIESEREEALQGRAKVSILVLI
jgi:hypothetical protein